MTVLESAGATALGGIGIAIVGLIIARYFTGRWERARARRERDEAAAADFYQAYGGFFAAWKTWEAALKEYEGWDNGPTEPDPAPASPAGAERSAIVSRVADAEGVLESFVWRLALEHRLCRADLDRLWCFRQAYKQLRYRVRSGEPLDWFRRDSRHDPRDPAAVGARRRHVGFRSYIAFKGLAVSVAGLLARGDARARSGDPKMTRRQQVEYVTGSSDRLRARHADAIEAFQEQLGRMDPALRSRDWIWVVIAEDLGDGPPTSDRPGP